MKHKYILYKIKPGKREELSQWFKNLHTHYREEALETLREEQCATESAFVFDIGKDSYALIHATYKDELLGANLDREINNKHRKILDECLDLTFGTKIKLGYHLNV